MQLNPPPIQQPLTNGAFIHPIWALWLNQLYIYVGNIPSSGGDTPLVIISVSANHAMIFTERVVLCNSAGGGFTITLPAASDGNGLVYYIKKKSSDANVVTIVGTGGELIDGAASVTISGPYEAIRLVSNGATWLSL